MENSVGNKNVIKYLLIEFLIILLVVLGIFFYLKIAPRGNPFLTVSKSELPIKTASPAIKRALVSYFFTDEVNSIRPEKGDMYALVLVGYPDQKLPIHKDSEVNIVNAAKKVKAADLKPGDMILVAINYNLMLKKWIPIIPIPKNLKIITNPADIPNLQK